MAVKRISELKQTRKREEAEIRRREDQLRQQIKINDARTEELNKQLAITTRVFENVCQKLGISVEEGRKRFAPGGKLD
jgi:DNA-binding Xre family transcriptional regulator